MQKNKMRIHRKKKDASVKNSAAKVIFRPELFEQPEETSKQSTKEDKKSGPGTQTGRASQKRETRPVHETETVSVQRPSEPENVKTVIAEIIAEEDKRPNRLLFQDQKLQDRTSKEPQQSPWTLQLNLKPMTAGKKTRGLLSPRKKEKTNGCQNHQIAGFHS